MDPDQILATQDDGGAGAEGAEGSAGAGAEGGAGSDQPFLQVNERTSYRTADEAKAGFLEAQKTITTLSGMRAAVEKYVGKGNASPELIAQLFDELVTARREKAEAAAKAKSTTSSSESEDPRFEGKSAEQIAEIKRADKWFEDQAKKRGYVTQESIKELQDKLAALESAPEKQLESANEDAVRSGREWLDKELAGAKVSLNDGEMKRLVGRIQAYVDGDEETLGRWWTAVRTGNRTDQQAIIREAAEFALPSVKPGASLKTAAAAATAAKTKAQLTRNTARPLPQQGAGKAEEGKNNPKFAGLKDPKLTKAAMDKLDEMMAEMG